jgi:hypothetical protein
MSKSVAGVEELIGEAAGLMSNGDFVRVGAGATTTEPTWPGVDETQWRRIPPAHLLLRPATVLPCEHRPMTG